MSEHRFHGNVERLRSPERLALLETERVVDTCLRDIRVRTMLDAGVGSGVFAEAFAARGIDVSGIDVNSEMIEVARLFVPTGHFQMAAIEMLPYPENSFDLVFLGHVLHEANNALQALSEARRVARLRVAVLEWPYRREEIGPPLAHRLTSEKVTALVQQAGFQEHEEIALAHMVLHLMSFPL